MENGEIISNELYREIKWKNREQRTFNKSSSYVQKTLKFGDLSL